MNITEAEIKIQFDHVTHMGWMPAFMSAGYGVAPELLLALASRETNCHNIIGDGGHGHGIMQIDDRSFPEWCRQGKWKLIKDAVGMGAFVFRSKLNSVATHLPPDRSLPVAIAAYNCGTARALEGYHVHGDQDLYTTGHDYSRDVLHRMAVFKTLVKP